MKTIITERIELNGTAMERTVELQVGIGDPHLFDYRLLAKNLHTLLQELKYSGADATSQPLADKSDGWIEWKGGECPVAPSVVVSVRTQSDTNDDFRTSKACEWNWGRGEFTDPIIAYRLA